MTLTPAQRKYHAIKNALTSAEKDLIKFYQIQWMMQSRVPSVEEVTNYLRQKRPHIRQISVNYYLTRPPVKAALRKRGIPFEQHTQEELTGQQQAVAITVMNFADERPVAEKLDQLGVLPATYYAWLNDPNFRNFVQSLAEQNLVNIDPTAKTEFAKKIQQGEWNAIKFYMENTGTLKNNDVPQSEVIIMKLIEILQRHVQDTAVLGAIANEMIAAFSNRTLNPAAINSTYVENDPDLEAAKKQLGYG